jgi:hypothetical protein
MKVKILANEKDQPTKLITITSTTDPEIIQIWRQEDTNPKTLLQEIAVPVTGTPPVDQPPTAEAGQDIDVVENVLVTLDGSAKDDGQITDIQWIAPDGITLTRDQTDETKATFTSPTLLPNEDFRGLIFTLRVEDNAGHVSTDQCIVTVVKDITPPVCKANEHWDSTLRKCVPNDIPTTGKINVSEKWNNGHNRTFTGFDPDDKNVEVRADSGTSCNIDGNGNCTITGDRRRIYCYYNNYNSILTLTLIPNFKSSGDDCSLKLRSRHNESGQTCSGGSPLDGNRFGGYGFALSAGGWDSKREPTHNCHDEVKKGNYPNNLVNGKPVKIRHTVKDEGGKVHQIGEIDYLDGNGFHKVMDIFDDSPKSWMVDKNLYAQKSYFWIRNNGSGSITVREVTLEPLP